MRNNFFATLLILTFFIGNDALATDTNATYTDKEKTLLVKAARIAENLRHKAPVSTQTQIPQKEIITEAEAYARGYNILKSNDKNSVLVFKGDVHVNGDINAAWYKEQLKGMQWKNRLYSAVIDGNLVIGGALLDDDNVVELVVTKNLTCDYLFSYNGHMHIGGDVYITYSVYGQYNNGYLDILGDLHTPYVVAGDHDMPRDSAQEFIYIEAYEGMDFENVGIGMSKGSGWGWGWNYFEHPEKLLISDIRTKDGEFSEKKFLALIKAGKNPFVELED